MSTYSPYSAGGRVYNGSSSAPTRGPVDPMGYRVRGLKAKTKKDALMRQLIARRAGGK